MSNTSPTQDDDDELSLDAGCFGHTVTFMFFLTCYIYMLHVYLYTQIHTMYTLKSGNIFVVHCNIKDNPFHIYMIWLLCMTMFIKYYCS